MEARLSSWIAVIALLVIAAIGYSPVGEALFAPLDRLHWDLMVRQVTAGNSDKVATIVVDTRTIEALGPTRAYARDTHARLLDRLHDAASVCLDFMMITPQPEDGALAQAIAHHGRVVLIEQSNAPVGRSDLVLPPSPPLARAAAALGQRNVILSADHTVQGILPYLKIGTSDVVAPHIALQSLQVAGYGAKLAEISQELQDLVSSLGYVVPDALALMFPKDFDLNQYSYIDVLEGRVPPSAFENRILFVGDTVTDLSGGPYRLSAAGSALSRVQIDALAADALMEGNVSKRVAMPVRIGSGILIALGMIGICAFATARHLNVLAIAWISIVVAVISALPIFGHYWMPIGPALAICLLIYAIYGWRRADRARRALQDELEMLRAGEVSGSEHAAIDDSPFFDEIGQLMQRIRESRTAYVELIQSLPYPVFVEQGTKLVLSNDQGRELLDLLAADDANEGHREILAIARDEIGAAKLTREIRTAELTLNGRTHIMMVTPFGDGKDIADGGSMISFVDVHEIKAAAESDRITLRHMAHDLRNPLSTMLTMLNEHGGSGLETDENFLANLHRLVDYSLRVAQEFTQLSRAEHLDTRTFAPLSVEDLAVEAIDHVWRGAQAKRIEVEGPQVRGDDAFVLGSRDMLLRALVNLLENAIKYSPMNSRVDVHVEVRGDAVEIRVADSGIGIDADALPHLFEPFFQAGGTSDDPTLGVGLGLPFVRAVVGRHGGMIDVESTTGVGSCFTIRLPRADVDTLGE
ncbi:ATP-binding protein [Burkholderia pseudomallei]|uniref:sensor histidine kinase n=1 Tax=Burkholderia pseudomallei TaxID=28450 RepID=UPI001E3B31E0|nr:ATP-binding protein [Burkholderia pseudomallei]